MTNLKMSRVGRVCLLSAALLMSTGILLSNIACKPSPPQRPARPQSQKPLQPPKPTQSPKPPIKEVIQEKITKGQRTDPINVLHVTLEFPGSALGGVGSVAGGLVRYETNYGEVAEKRGEKDQFMEASAVTPWYDVIKPAPDEAKHVMQISHWFKGEVVQSEVFMRKNNGMTQYLVKPSEKYKQLFDIGNASQLFNSFPHSSYIERATYFVSAATSFAAEFKDTQTHHGFDVAHIHSMVLGFMPRIFSEVYLPKVKKGEGTLPKTVFHLHSDFDIGLGNLSSADCALMGVNAPQGANAVAESVKGVDTVVAVSKWLAGAALKNPIIGPGLTPEKIHGILNGIDYEAHSPAKLKGEAGEDLSFSADNAVSGKRKIKKYLAKKGVFKEPDRPLIVFVGRYSNEKGIEMLPVAAEHAMQLGSNVVIMGTFAADHGPFKIIEDFKNAHKDNPRLHVILTLEEQRKGNLGSLIRAAADFGLVPSFKEGGGLVPREFMCSGGLAITSGVEGLAEQIQDFRTSPDPLKVGNGFIYGDDEHNRAESKNQMKKAIDDAIAFIRSKTMDDRKAILSRIMREAPNFDWMAENGAIEQIFTVYKSLL